MTHFKKPSLYKDVPYTATNSSTMSNGELKHTPWSQEDAEKWAMESDVVRKATFEDDAIEGFKAGMAKAAEMIEACETLRYTLRDGKVHTGSYEVFEAKLAGVRPIEEEK